MQRTMKRIGALVMALAMLVAFMPALGLTKDAHVNAAAKKSIKVFLTVSDEGDIAESKYGSPMAWEEVTVKDLDEDGQFTFDEALYAAHKEYYKGGVAGYAVGTYGVTKLWGVESGNVLFFINGDGLDTGVTADLVSEGDHLTASINADNAYYADWMTTFDAYEKKAGEGQDVELTLSGHLGMAYDEEAKRYKPLEDFQLGTWEDGEFVPIWGAVTDEDGKATIAFDDPGDYVVTAKGYVEDVVTDWNLVSFGAGGTPPYGRINWTTWESEVAYTDKDYGTGPYPADEIKYINFFEETPESTEEDPQYVWETLNYLESDQVISECPIIAPVCKVTVPEPISVFFTLNNKGVIEQDLDHNAIIDAEITVEDEDRDGEITVYEALLAAHRAFYKDGVDGLEITSSTTYDPYVSKFWGDTSGNYLFFLDGKDFYQGVTKQPIKDYDSLYASINQSGMGADVYSEFDKDYKLVCRGRRVKFSLTGYAPMATLSKKELAGIQIGIWNVKDGMTPIEGLKTDENGEFTIEFDAEGVYLITAQGSVKGTTSWGEKQEIDCPLMAPYCYLQVYEDEAEEVANAANNAILAIPDPDKLQLSDKKLVQAAVTAYDALSEDEKKYVANKDKSKLQLAVVTIDKLQTEEDLKNKKIEADEAEKKIKEDNEKIAVLQKQVTKVKAKAKKKKANLTWKSLGSGYKYEVYKATKVNGKFKKAATTSKTKATIKKLKSKKTFYFKVRAYKTINGKKVYTQYSDTVSAKIK